MIQFDDNANNRIIVHKGRTASLSSELDFRFRFNQIATFPDNRS
jgi:hypothetical protein